MLILDEPRPTEDEIKPQLHRILNSRTFIRRQKPSEVFKLLVEEALKGNTLNEADILNRVYSYSGYSAKGTNAREVVNALRSKLLPAFYKHEGAEDSVIISLPKPAPHKGLGRPPGGNPYPVLFTYSNQHYGNIQFSLAHQLMLQMTPATLLRAASKLRKLIERQPDHREGRALLAETLCIMAISSPGEINRAALLNEALGHVETLASQYPHEGQYHAILSAVLLCMYNRRGAQDQISEAMRTSPKTPFRHPWLAPLILATGEPTIAANAAFTLADEKVSDPRRWASFAFYCYFARRFETAAETFRSALIIDCTSWLANLGLALVYLATGSPLDAHLQYTRMQELLYYSSEPFMPGLGFLIALTASKEAGAIPKRLLEAGENLFANNNPETRDWIQLSLFAMAVGRLDYAASALMHAWNNHTPLTLLLPYWPLFDPLREHPDFIRLVQHIQNLPGQPA
jgi:tetratricopeptide (TPR) repeat protein